MKCFELKDIGNFYGGLSGKNKNDFKEGNSKFITYKNVYSNMEINLDQLDVVSIKEGEKQNKVLYGDIIFTGSSENLEECGISSVLTKKIDYDLYLNSFCFIFRFNDNINILPEFSKHLFKSRKIRDQIIKTASGVTRYNVSKEKMGKVKITLPPIDIQKDIAEKLDKFTEHISLLNEELSLRQKQYEYYRDELLTFGAEIERKALIEVFNLRNGYTPSTKNEEFWENGTISWFKMEDLKKNKRALKDANNKINDKAIKGKGLFKKNSILLATTATIGIHAMLSEDALANQQFTNFEIKEEYKDRLTPEFIYYYFFEIDKWCLKNQKVSSFPSVDMEKIKKFEIPLIALEKQKEIVNILDKFDVLCNDTLPKEIEMREKQYSYYRDLLLSF